MARREPAIYRRIRAALEKSRSYATPTVRAIYLDPADREELDAARSKETKRQVSVLGVDGVPITTVDFDGHPVKAGTTSRIFLKHGASVAVPKRLSAKVG